jgi:hypothetical protein
MFSNEVINAAVRAANANGIRPAALLALIQVETAGHPFEIDGKTPSLLFERHVCYREALKANCLGPFQRAGLAIPHWNRATQYKDQGSSAARIALIERARNVNIEVANRSASWGIGQTMGFNAQELGFVSATALVEHCATLDGQVDCLIRELKTNHIIQPLNDGHYATVALRYNGKGYAANHYDTRLAAADHQWEEKLKNTSQPAVESGQRPAPVPVDLPAHKLLTTNISFWDKFRAFFNHK